MKVKTQLRALCKRKNIVNRNLKSILINDLIDKDSQEYDSKININNIESNENESMSNLESIEKGKLSRAELETQCILRNISKSGSNKEILEDRIINYDNDRLNIFDFVVNNVKIQRFNSLYKRLTKMPKVCCICGL